MDIAQVPFQVSCILVQGLAPCMGERGVDLTTTSGLLRAPLQNQTTGFLMTLLQKLKSALSQAVAMPVAEPASLRPAQAVSAAHASSCASRSTQSRSVQAGNALSKARLIEHELPVPPTYAVVSSVGEVAAAWERVRSLNSFVIKSTDRRAASTALVVQRAMEDGDEFWRTPSGRRMTAAQIQGYMVDLVSGAVSGSTPDPVVIEYRVTIDDMFYQIYPRGLTGIRVYTYNGDAVLAMARIPTDPADAGASRGVLCAGIDMHSGMLSAACDRKGYLAEHPDTYASIEGVKINNWSGILKICSRTANAVPFEYLSIDLVVDADRGPIVMQVNERPGIDIQDAPMSTVEAAVAAGH